MSSGRLSAVVLWVVIAGGVGPACGDDDRPLTRRERRAEQRRQLQEAMIRAYLARLNAIAENDAERLAAADAARDRGEVALAATIYLRLGTSRRANASIQAAKQRYIDLRAEADAQLQAIDEQLQQKKSASAGDSAPAEAVEEAFRQYRALLQQFGPVPGIGTRLRSEVKKRSRIPEHAAVLNEPEARELWQQGRQLEGQGEVCCAFHVYEQAEKLRPAPSAQFAHRRLQTLRQDPQVVAQARRCAEVQRCRRIYERADRLAATQPRRAAMLLRDILRRAPDDSQVYARAAERLRTLP